MAALGQCSQEELREKIEEQQDFVLVDALAPISYAATHLPGAISIPPGTVDERAAKKIPDRDTEVVVYCTSPTCEAWSPTGSSPDHVGSRRCRWSWATRSNSTYGRGKRRCKPATSASRYLPTGARCIRMPC